MRRISSARLNSLQAEGAVVRRAAPAPSAPPRAEPRAEPDQAVDAFLRISQENSRIMSEMASVMSQIGASLAVNPAAGRAQDRPAVRGDIEFVAHRNSDGLIQSIDMVESGRVVRVATFNRDRDYRVTSVSTRTL